MRLIGLYSPAKQSGKSEVASVLNQRGYWTVKFAKPLKDMLRVLLTNLGVLPTDIERMVEGDLKEQVIPGVGVTPRFLMETIGTKWGRETVNTEFWVKVAETKTQGLLNAVVPVVIDDMRFPNEYEMVKRLGGTTVRIVRPGRTPKELSEGHLEGFDFDATIVNDGTLQALHDAAGNL